LKVCLRLRRRVNKFVANSKGFSSVIGTIFMVLIVMSLFANVFMWTLYQNTKYNEVLREKNQEEVDRLNENVIANGNYSVSGGKVTVNANLTNAGSVTVQIVNLWVFDTSKQTYGFNNSLASMSGANLNPGQVFRLTDVKVTVPSAASEDNFNVWFMTARGNAIPLTKSQSITTIPNALVAQGIGSISMDFKSYRSYVVNSSGYLGIPRTSFTFSYNEYLAFSINVTNLDPSRNSLILNQNCYFWVVSPPVGGGAIKGEAWKIAKVNAARKITSLGAGDFIILPYNVTTILYFGPYKPGGSNLTPGPVSVNLLLTGKIGSFDYGQNLPFIALIVTS